MVHDKRPVAPAVQQSITVSAGGCRLPSILAIPAAPRGAVIFAHSSGSRRFSQRNMQVVRALNDAGLITLLVDLLTAEEAADRASVFNIPLLAHRLVGAVTWVSQLDEASSLPVGLFGASTGAGAALWAAAELGYTVQAVVSRGGRPDLAAERLSAVVAPTLIIVGGQDPAVLDVNQQALQQLRTTAELKIVPEATHLFEEPGALEEVATLAIDWFRRYLAPARQPV